MKYFCTKCNRNHHSSSKIYEKHKNFKKIENNNISSNKVLEHDWEDLPKIAQRQIMKYIDKIHLDKKLNNSKNRSMYVQEINRVILKEK